MSVLVYGGQGALGRVLVNRLKANYKVISVDLRESEFSQRVSVQMVENQRNLCRFSYIDNAIFEPSKMKLALKFYCLRNSTLRN